MKYKKWLKTVPSHITTDKIWRMKVYRLSLFLVDISWNDIQEISKNKKLISLCDQLYRSTGSISANLEEGYSRNSNLDRARFFEYALGSARESRGWYYKARSQLSHETFEKRITLLTEIIKLLLHIIPTERNKL